MSGATFVSLFVPAFLASAHCVGMCGGFALALDRADRRFAPRVGAQLAFLLGKACTYALLGAVVGLAGGALVQSGVLGAAQSVLAVVAGVFLVWAGLQIAGLVRELPLARLFGPTSAYARALHAVGNARGAAVPFTLGSLAGLLPCPLVYAFLAAALATGSVLGAVGTMGVLGLASAPALLAVAFAGGTLSPSVRRRLTRLGGLVVVLVGLVTLARGLAPDLLHRLFGHGVLLGHAVAS